MSVTSEVPSASSEGQYVELSRISWDQYIAISEAIGERPNPRLIFLDGSLEIVVTSRHHDWYAERLGDLVKIVAACCRIPWEDAGTSTYQRKKKEAAVEGDKTFYLGDHARIMKGSVNIDLDTQPPPDLAIEVEVAHSANKAMKVWGRIGVPEVWRFDPQREKVSFWTIREDGTYEPIDRSAGFPVLTPQDVLEQMRLADEIGSSDWYERVRDWAEQVLLPRLNQ